MSRYDFSPEATRMKEVVERLFRDAPKLETTPPQAPALECAVMLKAGGQIEGALSVTPENTLRMLAPLIDKKGNLTAMAEHHFDYEQLANVALIRRVTADQPASTIISG